jgi:hypothetical protein
MTVEDLENNPELIIKLTEDAITKSKTFLDLCNLANDKGFAGFSQIDKDTGESQDFTLIKGNVIAYRTEDTKINTIVNYDETTIIGGEYEKGR